MLRSRMLHHASRQHLDGQLDHRIDTQDVYQLLYALQCSDTVRLCGCEFLGVPVGEQSELHPHVRRKQYELWEWNGLGEIIVSWISSRQ